MKNISLLLVFWLLLPTSLQAENQAYSVHKLEDEVDLGPWLKEDHAPSSLTQAWPFWSYPNFGLFESKLSATFTLDFAELSREDLILNVDYASLDHILLYQKDASGWKLLGERGFLKAAPALMGELTPSFALPPLSGQHTFRLEVETNSQMIVPIKLMTRDTLQSKMRQRSESLNLIYGALLAMLAFNTLLAFGLRDRLYFVYVGWMASFVIANAGWDGLIPRAFADPAWQWLWDTGSYLCLHSGYFLGTYFIIRFLRLKEHNSFFYKIGPATLGLYAFAFALTVFDSRPGLWLFSYVYSVTGGLFVSAAVIWAFRGSRAAAVLATGWTPVIIGQGIQIGTNLGIVPVSDFIGMIPHRVVIFESVVISLALALRFIEKEKSQQSHIKALNQELIKRNDIVQELNRNLEIKVREKTQNIKSILEFIELGIFTIERESGRIAEEHSRFLIHIFPDAASQRDPIKLLFQHADADADTVDRVRSAIAFIVGEAVVNFELNRENLLRELRVRDSAGDRILELDWNAIIEEDIVVRLLVTVKDVTEINRLAEASRQQKKELDYIAHMLNAKTQNFARFLRSGHEMLAKIDDQVLQLTTPKAQDLQDLFIVLHTFKGMTRTLSLQKLSNFLHEFESYVHDVREYRATWNIDEARSLFRACQEEFTYYRFLFNERLGRSEQLNESVEVSLEVLAQLHREALDLCQSLGRFRSPAVAKLEALLYRPFDEFLRECCYLSISIAADLGKKAPTVEVATPNIKISRPTEDMLYHTFIHIVRNAMDHGIESDAERLARGKEPAGKLSIQIKDDPYSPYITVQCSDDGRGINLKAIEEKAKASQLIAQDSKFDDQSIAELIFRDGISTAQAVTQISGRGIGMNAVRRFIVDHAHGDVRLHLVGRRNTEGFAPFVLELHLPRNLFMIDDAIVAEQKAS